MKIIRLTFSILTVLVVQWLTAQTSAMAPLKVGEQSPDYVFEKMLNYNTPTSKISDFRGKLLLLDVWSPWCASCIMSFPKMDALQEKFRDKIQVLLVGDDGYQDGRIPKYVNSKKGTSMEVKLPVPVIKKGDVFRRLFDWTGGLPHVIWIDSTGKIIAITDGIAVSSENIAQVLNGKNLSFTTKTPIRLIEGSDNFLLNRLPLFPGNPVYGSAFSGYKSEIGVLSPIVYLNDSTQTRVYFANRFLIENYLAAYNGAHLFPDINSAQKRVIVEDSALQKYKNLYTEFKQMTNWEIDKFNEHNRFSYELNLPPQQFSDIDLYKYMIGDFDRFFRIKSGVEKRKVKCLALVRTSLKDKLKTTLKEGELPVWEIDYKKISMKGYKMQELLRLLNIYINTSLLAVDETGYQGKVDITILQNADLNTYIQLLKNYDLELKEVEREQEFLVIKSAN